MNHSHVNFLDQILFDATAPAIVHGMKKNPLVATVNQDRPNQRHVNLVVISTTEEAARVYVRDVLASKTVPDHILCLGIRLYETSTLEATALGGHILLLPDLEMVNDAYMQAAVLQVMKLTDLNRRSMYADIVITAPRSIQEAYLRQCFDLWVQMYQPNVRYKAQTGVTANHVLDMTTANFLLNYPSIVVTGAEEIVAFHDDLSHLSGGKLVELYKRLSSSPAELQRTFDINYRMLNSMFEFCNEGSGVKLNWAERFAAEAIMKVRRVTMDEVIELAHGRKVLEDFPVVDHHFGGSVGSVLGGSPE